jgi:transglutaminase-like putative cysteine protease
MIRTRGSLVGPLLFVAALLPLQEHRSAPPADIEAGEDAVIQEETLDVEIISRTEGRVRHSKSVRILTTRGAEEYGTVTIGYNPWVSIRSLRGSVVSPAGKRAEVKKQQVWEGSLFASFELYADRKHRTINFPGAVPGATLEYEYEQVVRNLYFLPDAFYLQEEVPARSKTFTVKAPAAFPLRHAVRGASPEYSREERDGSVIHRWRVRDVPGLKDEPDMPPEDDLWPRVSIYLKEIQWDEHRIDASNWNGIARWYWDLARDRMVPDAAVTAAAREITAGASEPMEKIRRIYEFAQGKVQYVAIALGIGGWQPHASGQVLRHRYGDCKDKATLMVAMLQAVGLVGYPVLILTRDDGLTDRDYPSAAFNHAIVAVPVPDGYLFMDPTSEKTPFGDLPWTDQGVPVLVVREDGRGDLVETPLFPPERNRRHRLVTATINAAGDLTGDYIIDVWGQRRSDMADLLESKPSERKDDLADLMSWLCPGAVLLGHEVTNPSQPEDPLRITIRFQVPRFTTRAGAKEIVTPYLVRFPGLTRIAAYSGRRLPVFFDYLFSETSEVHLRLPEGRTLKKVPDDREIKGPGLIATTRHELVREGDRQVLVVRRSVSVGRREFPVADYPALRDFLGALGQEEARAVTLEIAG